MRSFVVASLLVTTLFALPAASAAAFAEDPTGDTETRALGGPGVQVASPGSEGADILSMDIAEDAEALVFTLKVAAMPAQASFSEYAIHFSWAKDEYVIYAYRQIMEPLLTESTFAYIVNRDAEDRFDTLAELEHSIDVASGSFIVHLPKAYLADDRGRYPLLGDQLKEVYVEAESSFTFFGFTAASYDRMPDGEDSLKYDLIFGDLAVGTIRLDADERVRVSNGGATTFVYRVLVENKGEIDDEVTLELKDMPPAWNGTVQSPLRIPGGAERTVAVLVSVPFAHEHGGFSSFNVTATSARNPGSLAAVRMGVLHTPIPQPAGHHAELFLHAEEFNGGLFGEIFGFVQSTMNTEGDHATDAAEASARSGRDGIYWYVPLAPSLRMGLDFDIEQVGEVAGSIVGHTTGTGRVSAELVLTKSVTGEDDAETITLAESDAADITLDMSNAAPFKLTLTPTLEADYVPYAKGQNLVLYLNFEEAGEGLGTICCIEGATPGLVTADFKMSLPLNEYHDKLSGLAEAEETLGLTAEGAVEKSGLPGTTMTYAFTLVNRGTEPLLIDLDVAGTDAALGTLVPSGTIEIGAKDSRKLTLAVGVPTGRNEGEELEVLIFAHAQDDPSVSAIARTKTIIAKAGSSQLVGDESSLLTAAQEAEANDTPAPGVLLFLTALGVTALAARRRK